MNGQKGRIASLCQMLLKSFKPRRRYVSFRFFKMVVAAILDFSNFKLLTVGTVKRVELHHHVKFRQNRSNRGPDNYGNFAIFPRWQPSAILDL